MNQIKSYAPERRRNSGCALAPQNLPCAPKLNRVAFIMKLALLLLMLHTVYAVDFTLLKENIGSILEILDTSSQSMQQSINIYEICVAQNNTKCTAAMLSHMNLHLLYAELLEAILSEGFTEMLAAVGQLQKPSEIPRALILRTINRY